MKNISRRDFIKKAGVITSSAFLIPQVFPGMHSRVFAENYPDLVKSTGPSAARNTEAAIDALGGMSRFVSKGDVVMIKPNMSWAREPKYAANTNPDVVEEIVKLCYNAGAKKVKVTDNTCNNASTCYSITGIEQAAKKAGGDVFFTEDYMFKTMDVGGEFVKDWKVNTEIVEADVLINVPIAKHHKLARLTIGMKNWIGAVGGGRFGLHQDINQSIVDLAHFFKPDLTVVDCTRILMNNGPQGGNLADVKVLDTIIATTDPVAADSYAAQYFDLQGKDITYVRLADEKGLGKMNLDEITIKNVTA